MKDVEVVLNQGGAQAGNSACASSLLGRLHAGETASIPLNNGSVLSDFVSFCFF